LTNKNKSSKYGKGKGRKNEGKNNDPSVDSNEKTSRGAHSPSSLPYCSSKKQTMAKKEPSLKTAVSSKKDSKFENIGSSETTLHKSLKSKVDDSTKYNSDHKKKLPPKYIKSTSHSKGVSEKGMDNNNHVYSMKKTKDSNSHKKIHHTSMSHPTSHSKSSQNYLPVSTIPIGTNGNNNKYPSTNAVKVTGIDARR
jgi:hypothetical protein